MNWVYINCHGYIPPAQFASRGLGEVRPQLANNVIFVHLNWTESAYGWRGCRNAGNGDTIARAVFDDGYWMLEVVMPSRMVFAPLASHLEAFRLAEVYFAPINNIGI